MTSVHGSAAVVLGFGAVVVVSGDDVLDAGSVVAMVDATREGAVPEQAAADVTTAITIRPRPTRT